ncbi:MAG: hypothetical protein WCO98_16300 [bacterium]
MKKKHLSGITLVEILVTIVLLSFGIVACVQAINQAAVSLNNAQRVGVATTLLESEIEEMRSLGVPGYMSNMDAEVTAGRATKTLSGTVATYTMVLKNIVPRLPADVLNIYPNGNIVITPNGLPFTGATAGSNEANMNAKMYRATVVINWRGMKNNLLSAQMSSMIVVAAK